MINVYPVLLDEGLGGGLLGYWGTGGEGLGVKVRVPLFGQLKCRAGGMGRRGRGWDRGEGERSKLEG